MRSITWIGFLPFSLELAEVTAIPDVTVQTTLENDNAPGASNRLVAGIQATVPVPVWDRNLGAILRSAEAAAAEGVILPERRSAPLSPAAVKASSGASELLPLCRVPGLASAISEVKRGGLWCCALDMRGELAPWEFDLTQPVCLVVGGEGQGVGRLVRERCDVSLRLPMRGKVGSLNASAAAAALLYEVLRQRSG